MHPIAEKLQALQPDAGDFFPAELAAGFPHVLNRVLALWDKPELVGFLHHLQQPPPPPAQGFPITVLYELARLEELVELRNSARSQTEAAQPAAAIPAEVRILREKVRRRISGLDH